MNPMTNIKNVLKLSESELGNKYESSWHDQYRDSAWIFIGGLPYDLTEGDIICIFSQFGEPVNINLIREKDTGKSKGFCFLCYEDQRSTILAVDNFNGIKILNRTIRVDHVAEYKVPKEGKKTDDKTKMLYAEGCASTPAMELKRKSPPRDFRETISDQIEADIKLPARLPIRPIKQEIVDEIDIELPERLPVRPVKELRDIKREDSEDSSRSRKRHKSKKKKRSSSESPERKKSKKKHKKSKRD